MMVGRDYLWTEKEEIGQKSSCTHQQRHRKQHCVTARDTPDKNAYENNKPNQYNHIYGHLKQKLSE